MIMIMMIMIIINNPGQAKAAGKPCKAPTTKLGTSGGRNNNDKDNNSSNSNGDSSSNNSTTVVIVRVTVIVITIVIKLGTARGQETPLSRLERKTKAYKESKHN